MKKKTTTMLPVAPFILVMEIMNSRPFKNVASSTLKHTLLFKNLFIDTDTNILLGKPADQYPPVIYAACKAVVAVQLCYYIYSHAMSIEINRKLHLY